MRIGPTSLLTICLGTGIMAAQTAGQRASSTAPNILVMIADDLGWADISLHQGQVQTPNVDRLGKSGVEFQRFYAHPVCSPTRAAFLTGQMPRRFGIVHPLNPREPGLPAGLPLLPRSLQAAGYQTSLVGKWHLGNRCSPRDSGFDHFYGFLGAEVDYFKHTSQNGALDWQRNGQTLNEAGYSTLLLANEAIQRLKDRDPAKPFFLEVAFNAPHFPVSAPEEYLARYRHFPARTSTYAAVVSALDDAVGKILAALEKQGLSERTLVLFFSDNGAGGVPGGSNAPLRAGKDTVFEGGIRTLCLMRWPGHLKAGTISQQPLAVYDLYPTLAAAAGITLPAAQKLDGRNLWPAILSGAEQDRGPFLIAHSDFALFEDDWKLIETAAGRRALFQLAKDPEETIDLLQIFPDVARQMETRLAEIKQGLPEVQTRPRPGPGGKAAKSRQSPAY